jgi:exportin-T
VEFPSDWPAFFYDVIAMLGHGLNAADMFVRILVALDEDIISLDIPRSETTSVRAANYLYIILSYEITLHT